MSHVGFPSAARICLSKIDSSRVESDDSVTSLEGVGFGFAVESFPAHLSLSTAHFPASAAFQKSPFASA